MNKIIEYILVRKLIKRIICRFGYVLIYTTKGWRPIKDPYRILNLPKKYKAKWIGNIKQ